MPRLKKDKSYCIGCSENFYNGNNPYGVKECWNYKDAKVCTLYKIGNSTPMNRASNFWEVITLSCHREQGYSLLPDIPTHLQDEWIALKKTQVQKLKAIKKQETTNEQ